MKANTNNPKYDPGKDTRSVYQMLFDLSCDIQKLADYTAFSLSLDDMITTCIPESLKILDLIIDWPIVERVTDTKDYQESLNHLKLLPIIFNKETQSQLRYIYGCSEGWKEKANNDKRLSTKQIISINEYGDYVDTLYYIIMDLQDWAEYYGAEFSKDYEIKINDSAPITGDNGNIAVEQRRQFEFILVDNINRKYTEIKSKIAEFAQYLKEYGFINDDNPDSFYYLFGISNKEASIISWKGGLKPLVCLVNSLIRNKVIRENNQWAVVRDNFDVNYNSLKTIANNNKLAKNNKIEFAVSRLL